ncbi:MAG TPA: bifunctional DNA primase/polymerase [Trebonia sp.]|nr:bifunctional DNA primase/polymerase [Trebonia sp.]
MTVNGELEYWGLMVTLMRRKGRARGTQKPPALGAAALDYAALGWPVCLGAQPSRGIDGTMEMGRACSCDRVGCPAPGAHPVSPTWQMQATTDTTTVRGWWEARPEANVILVTGRVFDVLDVPAVAGANALAKMAAADVDTGPVAVDGTDRMHFFVTTRGAPADEDEWWSCGLDSSPDPYVQTESLRWHCRESYVLAPPSRYGTGQDVRWVRAPAGQPLPDAVRLLEFLADACEEEGC